mgnify:CR=1 FL=1
MIQLAKGILLLATAAALLGTGMSASGQNTGSVSVVSGKDLGSGTRTLSGLLAGKVPGLLAVQSSAVPGDGSSLWIRGVRTSGTDSSPLVFVDGVECDLDLVDVEDVDKITILKDASATALYGVRGANGVILIETRHGGNSKPKVGFSAMYGLLSPINMPEMAGTMEWLGYYTDLVRQSGAPAPFTEDALLHYRNGDNQDLYPSVDWMGDSFRNLSTTSKYNVSVTGGSAKVHYYISGSYMEQNGLLNIDKSNSYSPQVDFKRFSFLSNVDMDLSPSTSLSFGISSQYKTVNSPVSSISSIMTDILTCTPVATPARFSDGTLAEPMEYGTVNPYNEINSKGYKRTSAMYAQSHITLVQDLSSLVLEGLKAKVNFTWAVVNGNSLSRYRNPIYYYINADDPYNTDGSLNLGAKNNGSNYLTLSKSVTSNTIITLEPAITYDRTFGEHSVNVVMQSDLRYRTENVPVSWLYSYPYKHLSVGGRLNYGFKNRCFVDLAASYSGSDNFEKGHRYGFYPSAAIGYTVSEEPFWNGIKPFVNVLRIKASYGVNGSDQTGSYSRRYVFNNTLDTYASGATFGTSGQYSPDGISTQYYGYPGLGMEKSVKADIGLDLELFDCLSLSAEFYTDNRSGIFIYDEKSPSVSGLENNYINVGEMDSHGFELSAAFHRDFGRSSGVEVFGTFMYNRSKVLADGKPEQPESYMNTVGHPYGQQFGLVTEGLFGSEEEIKSSPKQMFGQVNVGDIRYKDLNGDGIVDYRDVTAIGHSSVPEISYGFGFRAHFGSLDLSVGCSGFANVTRLLSGTSLKGGAENAFFLGQLHEDVARNRWTSENTDAKYPRMYLNGSSNNSQASTWWLRDMSFLRVRDVEVGYSFLGRFRVFANAGNPLTFSKFKLWDPELGASDGAAYPMTSSYVLGLNVKF